jgi:hypothetical protein
MLRGAAAIAGIQATTAIITNESVCTALYDQNPPVSVPDGGGGSIVVWSDYRSGNLDIYAQKLDASGNFMWTTDGVPICKQAGDQTKSSRSHRRRRRRVHRVGGRASFTDRRQHLHPARQFARRESVGRRRPAGVRRGQPISVRRWWSPNGLGGVLVSWTDERGAAGVGDIYAQRVTAAGLIQWAANGVAMCTAAGNQMDPAVVTDTQGGAIASWRDERAGTDVYAQRVNEQASCSGRPTGSRSPRRRVTRSRRP